MMGLRIASESAVWPELDDEIGAVSQWSAAGMAIWAEVKGELHGEPFKGQGSLHYIIYVVIHIYLLSYLYEVVKSFII